MSTELLVIEKLELVPFFTKGDHVDDLLAKIDAETMAHIPDVSTLKGRNAIIKNITNAKKSRTYLEAQGKALAAEYKTIPKTIDATRKKVKEFLLASEEKARSSLTEWERIEKIEKKQIADTEAYLIKFDADVIDGYRDNELIDLRAKQAEAERQAEIKEAADKAAAEAKAQAEEEAAERIAQSERNSLAAQQREYAAKQAVIDAENKAAQEAIDAKSREDEAKRVAANAEWLNYIAEAYEFNDRRNTKAREDKAAQEALNATIIAQRDADRAAEQAAEDARLAEQQRQEDERLRQEEEQRQREENKRFTGGINTKVMNDFISLGIDADTAKLVTKALAAGKIRNAQIIYK